MIAQSMAGKKTESYAEAKPGCMQAQPGIQSLASFAAASTSRPYCGAKWMGQLALKRHHDRAARFARASISSGDASFDGIVPPFPPVNGLEHQCARQHMKLARRQEWQQHTVLVSL